ncbi:glycoside hydrolase family 1 protein [Candidatus Saccharibacteria bacterium]|nr:glycoside hydrolase family 1 protein [Candidatus Saccharibacteria bacterium]
MKLSDPKLPKRSEFPKDFYWGVSVASHQVEGGNHNQWTRWEHKTAARLAATAEDRLGNLPIWNEIKNQAEDAHNYVSGSGVGHYSKYLLDFKLAKTLNLNAFRSSIEWSRINPQEGVFDAKEIEHYSEYFRAMKAEGLEPFVTLFHWSVPQWFADKGGFAKRSNLRYWRDFVHVLAQNMDLSGIKYVLTINEANTFSGMGYAVGEFPPGEKKYLKSLVVYRNLALAHRIAYKIVKNKFPNIQVGSANQFQKAIGKGIGGKISTWFELQYSNWGWVKASKYYDFIGFNYYFTDYRNKLLSVLADSNPTEPINDIGFYMEPSGIDWVLKETSKRYKNIPILITENGVADMHDQYREWWLVETIQAMSRALKSGVPLIGYLHWSLLDNFEWQYGWWPKFGLISVDRKTMKRRVKPSAKAWAKWLGATQQ